MITLQISDIKPFFVLYNFPKKFQDSHMCGKNNQSGNNPLSMPGTMRKVFL
jgi:hypothetical protein